jgi:hypothetical protein
MLYNCQISFRGHDVPKVPVICQEIMKESIEILTRKEYNIINNQNSFTNRCLKRIKSDSGILK